MTLTRSANFDAANEMLTQINSEAEHLADNNLQSDMVHLEDIYCGLLNLVYGLNLKNANEVRANFPGIDLIDKEARVCVQVTADASSEKMRETLAKPVMERLAEGGYTLKFCYVGRQNKNAKRRHPKNPFGVRFDASVDVIFTSDVLGEFSHMPIEGQEKVLALLKRETGKGYILSAEWLRERLESAKKILGPRYTPEAGVDTPDMERLAAFAGSQRAREEIAKSSRAAKSSLAELAKRAAESGAADKLNEVMAVFTPVSEVLGGMPDEECGALGFYCWAARLDECVSGHEDVWSVCQLAKGLSGKDRATVEECGRRIRELGYPCSSYGVRFLKANAVLVEGEAGIGKSHLLADFCERELESGNPAVMVLGSQFHGQRSSEEDIPGILGLSGTLVDLFAEMQRHAATRGSAAYLVIDALNEGNGRSFWRDALPALLEKAAAYPGVRLVASVRSTYVSDIVPECLVEGEDYIAMECEGLGDASFTALKMYCDHYGIDLPFTPLLGTEFSNPLYLKLLCEHAKEHGGRLSKNSAMGKLVAAFLDDVNGKLAGSQALDYDGNIGLVSRAVRAIAGSPSFRYGYMRYDEACALVADEARDYVSKPGDFLASLVAEGLFNVTGDRDARFLVFSYELVGNYAAAFAIVEEAKAATRSGDRGSCAEALGSLLRSRWDWALHDQGILAALGAIIPTECGCELFDLGVDSGSSFSPVPIAFVDGLPWRASVKMTSDMDRFIRKRVLAGEFTRRSFFGTSFQLATRHGGIDAGYFRELLMPLPMPERDAAWSSAIASMGHARMFAKWAWENGDKLDDADAESVATVLALCLAGTNVLLRREAMKALAITLIGRPVVAGRIWGSFCDIDDDYVLEGLCGGIYGAAVNSERIGDWEGVVRTVHERIICDGNAYPNAVVRDYAVALHDAVLGSRPDALRFADPYGPVFQSEWYPDLPGNEEIDGLVNVCVEEYGPGSREALNVKWIVRSMTTEYGRGTGMYGDFGRYTLGYQVAPWANLFESDQLLSNALTKHVLTRWYKPQLHSEYDSEIGRLAEYGEPGCERIGKKYQKIALNRLVARLSDNFVPRKRHGDGAGEPWSAAEVYGELVSQRSHDPSFPWMPSTLKSPYDMERVYPSVVTFDNDPEPWCRGEAEFESLDEDRLVTLDGTRYYTLAVRKEWSPLKGGKHCRKATWDSYAMLVGEGNIASTFGHYPWSKIDGGYPDVLFGEFFDGLGYRVESTLCGSDRADVDASVIETWCSYDWDGDRSELDVNSSVFIPCEILVRHFGLTRRGALRWVNADGKVLALCLVEPESDGRALLFDADSLDEYMAGTGRALMWVDYFEKLTRLLIYRKWANVVREGDGYRSSAMKPSGCYELDRGLWSSDDWVDA